MPPLRGAVLLLVVAALTACGDDSQRAPVAGGPEAAASVSTFTTRKSRVRQAIVLLYVRSGGNLGSLTAIGPAEQLDAGDVLALEPALHGRLAPGS